MLEAKRKFKDDGFVKISKNLSFYKLMSSIKDEACEFFQEYERQVVPRNCISHGRAIDQRLDTILPIEIKNSNPLYGKRYILDVSDFSENLIKVIEHEHILNVAKNMLNTEKVVLHNGSFSGVYPGNTGNGDMYHSDTANFCNKKSTLNLLKQNKHLVNIMILFDDVDETKAPMRIFKKTHEINLHTKINDHVSKKLKFSPKYDNLIQENWIYKELLEDFNLEEVSFTGNYGDVAAMNSFALHKASPNYSKNQVRKVMILNFGREDDVEFLRKYPYEKSKLFLSKLTNKQIGNVTYRKNSSFFYKFKWKIENIQNYLKDLINKNIKRLNNPTFVIGKIKLKIYFCFASIIKKERDLLNIGGGVSFKHPNFYNFDVREDIHYDKNKGLIKFDFSKNLPLPFGDASISGIYSSHCLEHLTDRQVKFVLKEAFRILKPLSPLRIVLPDMKQMFDAFENRDAHYLEELRNKQSGPNFLWIYDTWLRLITRTFAGHVVDLFSDTQLNNMYSKLNRDDYIKKILKEGETIPSIRFVPNCHKSYWDYNKLEGILQEIGFTKIKLSKRGMSQNPIFKNRSLFDNTAPERSFILEAYK